jgi:hypothetical protein
MRRGLCIAGTLVVAIGVYWVARGVVHELAAHTLACSARSTPEGHVMERLEAA